MVFTGQLSSSATQRSDMREAIEACNKSGSPFILSMCGTPRGFQTQQF